MELHVSSCGRSFEITPKVPRGCLEDVLISDGMRFARYVLGSFHRSRRCLLGRIGAVAGTRPYPAQRVFGTPGDRISYSRKVHFTTGHQQQGLPEAGPLAAYARLVGEGKIHEDEHQLAALQILQEVCTACVILRVLLVSGATVGDVILRARIRYILERFLSRTYAVRRLYSCTGMRVYEYTITLGVHVIYVYQI